MRIGPTLSPCLESISATLASSRGSDCCNDAQHCNLSTTPSTTSGMASICKSFVAQSTLFLDPVPKHSHDGAPPHPPTITVVDLEKMKLNGSVTKRIYCRLYLILEPL
jgi:hypothetical protein